MGFSFLKVNVNLSQCRFSITQYTTKFEALKILLPTDYVCTKYNYSMNTRFTNFIFDRGVSMRKQ